MLAGFVHENFTYTHEVQSEVVRLGILSGDEEGTMDLIADGVPYPMLFAGVTLNL